MKYFQDDDPAVVAPRRATAPSRTAEAALGAAAAAGRELLIHHLEQLVELKQRAAEDSVPHLKSIRRLLAGCGRDVTPFDEAVEVDRLLLEGLARELELARRGP